MFFTDNKQHRHLGRPTPEAKGLSLVVERQILATAVIVVFAAGERKICFFGHGDPRFSTTSQIWVSIARDVLVKAFQAQEADIF